MATSSSQFINFLQQTDIFRIISVFILTWVFVYIILKYFLSNTKSFSESSGSIASIIGFFVAILVIYNLAIINFLTHFLQFLTVFIIVIVFGILIYFFFVPQKEFEDLLNKLSKHKLFILFLISFLLLLVLFSLFYTLSKQEEISARGWISLNPGFIGTILFFLFLAGFLALFEKEK